MQDGHQNIEIQTSSGVDLKGDGWTSFKPHMADYAKLTGTQDGSDVVLEMLSIGSVGFAKSGSAAELPSAKWERTIVDRLLTSPSEYMLGVTKTSGMVRPAVTADSVGDTPTWLVKADTADGLQELWLRQSDGYLVRYRLTAPNGDVSTSTFDRYNIKPSVVVPPDSQVVEGAVSCGFATSTDLSPQIGQRVCGLEALGAPYESVDFASTATLPAGLIPYVVDYAGNETRKNEGVKIESGAAVFTSESVDHEVDLVFSRDLADVVVVADYEQTGAPEASLAGISLRCSAAENSGAKGCIYAAVDPDGHFRLEEKATAGSEYKTVVQGQAKVNAGSNRLVMWAHGDQVGVALNGTLLGTYTTGLFDAAPPFFAHTSLSKTEQSQVRLLDFGIYESRPTTIAELMGP